MLYIAAKKEGADTQYVSIIDGIPHDGCFFILHPIW
jgi:hypothetical protein